MHDRIIEAIANTPWAITEEALSQIIQIAEKNGDLEALQQRVGRQLPQTRGMSVRDGIAIAPVVGPLFRRANLFTEISGATSYEVLATDLRSAADDPSVRGIALDIDSPGGEANGVSELAQQIRAISQVKPVHAFVGGSGASGGYWLAAAAPRVFAADTAFLGSIGVRSTIVLRDAPKGQHTYRFVSSVSPDKDLDMDSAEGRSKIQQMVDDLGEVFVAAVAEYRGTDRDTVLADFGQGHVLIAERALSAGMIDDIATFEDVLADMAGGSSFAASGGISANAGDRGMDKGKETKGTEEGLTAEQVTADWLAENRPEVAQALRKEGEESVDTDTIRTETATAERERITAILKLRDDSNASVIDECIADPECSYGDAAGKVIEHNRDPGKQHVDGQRKDEKDLEAPKGSATDAGAGHEAGEAALLAHQMVEQSRKAGAIN